MREEEADLSAVKEPLMNQITDQVQALPQNLRQQVLDYIEYLRTKYVSERNAQRDQALEATFGSWEDDREPEQIVQDIYAQRTISEPKANL